MPRLKGTPVGKGIISLNEFMGGYSRLMDSIARMDLKVGKQLANTMKECKSYAI